MQSQIAPIHDYQSVIYKRPNNKKPASLLWLLVYFKIIVGILKLLSLEETKIL